eukprot:11207232-Ditylum_brightwellii.AAC.1
MQEDFVNINDKPQHHSRKSFFEKDGIIVLVPLNEVMMTLNTRKSSKFELNTCKVIAITEDEIWDPQLFREDAIDENAYDQL